MSINRETWLCRMSCMRIGLIPEAAQASFKPMLFKPGDLKKPVLRSYSVVHTYIILQAICKEGRYSYKSSTAGCFG